MEAKLSSRLIRDSIFFKKHINGLGTSKNLVIAPKTKNDCADKGQQKCTEPLSLYRCLYFSPVMEQ
jgi:hypothetical protein